MIVVSDTSPLTALLTVQKAELLLQIVGEVVIPDSVKNELSHSHDSLPTWLHVRPIKNKTQAQLYSKSVDVGEAEAITLAREIKADYLLMDERKGRRLAKQEGLTVVGLLGIVLIAKRTGLINSARALLLQLERQAGVYLGEKLKEDALKTVGE